MATARKDVHGIHFFPPWFLSKPTMRKIEALLPYYYHLRFRIYFDRYGCVRCGKKNVVYCCCGLCIPCNGLINDRLKATDRTMKKRFGKGTGQPCSAFLRKMKTARELLADFRSFETMR